MIKEICIDNLHGIDLYDLDIYIVSPDNIFMELSTDNGYRAIPTNTEDKMLNTCFTPSATIPINNGNPVLGDIFPSNPTYTGNFKPEGNWSDLINSQSNGDWKLFIQTDESGYEHTLESWHITFNSSYALNYNWSPANNISCTTCLSPNIYPTLSQYYFLNTSDTYGCQVRDSIFADIDTTEDILFIDCDSISTDFIRFVWSSENAGDIYEIKIDESVNWIETTDNYYDVTGLGFSQIVKIEVRVKNTKCPNNSITKQCESFPCPPPDIQLLSQKNLVCYGDNNGEISLSADGTIGPYTFRYNNEINNSGYFTNLKAGEDTIFIKDGNNCEIPFVFNIYSPEKLNISSTINNISCFGYNDGSILSEINGGTSPFTYKLYNSDMTFSSSNKNISNIKSGIYFLSITDKNNCKLIDTFNITEPQKIIITDSIIDNTCKNYSDGKIFLNISGGTPPFYYDWDTPIGLATENNLINIPAGAYNLHLTDANNCYKDTTYIVTEPAIGINYTVTSNDTICYGTTDGEISINYPTNENYTIQWDDGFSGNSKANLLPGIYNVSIIDENGCKEDLSVEIIELGKINIDFGFKNPSCHDFNNGEVWIDKIYYGTTEVRKSNFDYIWNTPNADSGAYIYGLSGGTEYIVTASDKLNCKEESSIILENPEEMKIKTNQISNVTCFNGNDGYIEIEVANYENCTYNWNTTEHNDTNFISDLKSGIYQVTITNKSGCKANKQFNITEPSKINTNFIVDDVSCNGGSNGKIEAIISGGTEPYFVLWEDSLHNTVINNLKPGIYHIKINDLNGCIIYDSVSVNQPENKITFDAEAVDATCFGGNDGELILDAQGGSPPYSYKVIGNEFYGSNKLIGLTAGEYTVVIKDNNNCYDTLSNITINEGKKIIVDLGLDTIMEYNQSLELFPMISNQLDPITYNWIVPTGTEISCNNCYSPIIYPKYNTEIKLIITDFNGCSAYDTKNIILVKPDNIFVPTAFNPNSVNHENSKLFIYGSSGIKVNHSRVFNNKGHIVYERNNFDINDETEGWDGFIKILF
ncbi:MAG: SprB repeat-containing protein [Saprospiraceae bacterium]